MNTTLPTLTPGVRYTFDCGGVIRTGTFVCMEHYGVNEFYLVSLGAQNQTILNARRIRSITPVTNTSL